MMNCSPAVYRREDQFPRLAVVRLNHIKVALVSQIRSLDLVDRLALRKAIWLEVKHRCSVMFRLEGRHSPTT